MKYHQMIKKLDEIGFSTYNFKNNVIFRNNKIGIELDVPRSVFPRKNASPEQCQYILNEATNLLNKHSKD